MFMVYIYLIIAIVAEVVGTSALKATEAFTRLWPSLLVVVSYSCAFYFLALCLRSMPIGIAYAIWSGLGIVLVAIAGIFIYREIPDLPGVIGITLIILGVIILNVFSKTTVH